jgi:hypothetical protein
VRVRERKSKITDAKTSPRVRCVRVRFRDRFMGRIGDDFLLLGLRSGLGKGLG